MSKSEEPSELVVRSRSDYELSILKVRLENMDLSAEISRLSGQLEVMKNLANTKNQEIRKLRREIEKSQMIQCMDLLRIEYWQERADTADKYFKFLWSTISRIRLNINVPLAKPEDID